MAVPKRRVSSSRRGMRRSHQFRTPKQHTYCTKCGASVLPHLVCEHCGWHSTQGREVVAMEVEE